MRSVRHFDRSLNLYRNPWYEWKRNPHIEFSTNKDGKTIRLNAEPAIKAKDGKGGSYRMNNGIRNAIKYIEKTTKQPA